MSTQTLTKVPELLETLIARENVREQVMLGGFSKNAYSIDNTSIGRSLNIDGVVAPLTENAMSQFSTILGLDYGYFTNSHPDPEEEYYVVNHRLDRVMSDPLADVNIGHAKTETCPKSQLAAWMVDGAIEAFVNTDHVRVPAWQVLERVSDMIGYEDDVRVRGYHMTMGDVTVDLVNNTTNVEVRKHKVGDITLGGMSFTHPDGGQGVGKISSFLYRLVCTNGMVVPHNIRVQRLSLERHGDDAVDNYLDMFIRASQRYWDDINIVLAHWADAYEKRDLDYHSEISELTKLPTGARQMIEAAYDGEPMDHSYYGFVNAITQTAQSDNLSWDESRSLEERAGIVMNEFINRCDKCGNRVTQRLRARRN